MGRVIWTLGTVLMLTAIAWPAEPFNVDFAAGWEGYYRPTEWVPLEVGIASSLKEPFGGTITIEAGQDELTELSVTHPIVLTPDMPLRLPLVTKIAFATSECRLFIRDEHGRVRWSTEYQLWDKTNGQKALTAVNGGDLLIGVAGRKAFGLARLGENCVVERTGGGHGPQPRVYAAGKLPRLLPWDWTGYAALGALVLYNPEWDQINTSQARAISQWVSNGGKLVIVLGSNVLPPGHPIAKLIPFQPGEPVQVAMDERTAAKWGCDPDKDGLVLRPLDSAAQAGWEIDQMGLDAAAMATGLVGFGRVTVLGFDPSPLASSDYRKQAQFWVEVLNRQFTGCSLAVRPKDAGNRENDSAYSYWAGADARQNRDILDHLYRIPELRPLGAGWVLLLLGLLALLLGPVDYLVLKRLDRLPLTWITSACVIALFTVGAYFGVQALRAGKTQMRVVTVTDCLAGGDSWTTSYCGIFASASDDYRLHGLDGNQWWSAIAPMEEYAYYGRSGMAGRRLYCRQQDGANLPVSIPVNIWSMQCLICEGPQAQPPVEAEAEIDGDRIRLKVTNKSQCTIRPGRAIAACGAFPFRLPLDKPIPPGQTGEFSATRQPGGIGPLGPEALPSFLLAEPATGHRKVSADSFCSGQGCAQRSEGIRWHMKRGAVLVFVILDQAPPPYGLAERRYDVNHIQLVRLVVYPTPAAKGGT